MSDPQTVDVTTLRGYLKLDKGEHFITRKRFSDLSRDLGMSAEELDVIFVALDSDGDDVISLDDLLIHWNKRSETPVNGLSETSNSTPTPTNISPSDYSYSPPEYETLGNVPFRRYSCDTSDVSVSNNSAVTFNNTKTTRTYSRRRKERNSKRNDNSADDSDSSSHSSPNDNVSSRKSLASSTPLSHSTPIKNKTHNSSSKDQFVSLQNKQNLRLDFDDTSSQYPETSPFYSSDTSSVTSPSSQHRLASTPDSVHSLASKRRESSTSGNEELFVFDTDAVANRHVDNVTPTIRKLRAKSPRPANLGDRRRSITPLEPFRPETPMELDPLSNNR